MIDFSDKYEKYMEKIKCDITTVDKNLEISNYNDAEIDTSVKIGSLLLKNPVIAASGTYGFGREYSEYVDLNKIGGISVKGLTLMQRHGNKGPRIAEVSGGVLNSVGLQNPGVKKFIKDEIPFLRQFNIAIIANIAGNTVEEYCEMARILSNSDIDAIELNVSCPNVKVGGMAFGKTCVGIADITDKVKKCCDNSKPLIVKLTPNVTDIVEIAAAARDYGADAVSLINTLAGMAIDINSRRPLLGNNCGGYSGPAVKPVAVKMVYDVANTLDIPVIGMGGIETGDDAVEFILAGAKAVMVGTANFVNPRACIDVAYRIRTYMFENEYVNLDNFRGKVILN